MFDKITSEDLTAESDAFWDAKELQIWELRQEAIMLIKAEEGFIPTTQKQDN